MYRTGQLLTQSPDELRRACANHKCAYPHVHGHDHIRTESGRIALYQRYATLTDYAPIDPRLEFVIQEDHPMYRWIGGANSGKPTGEYIPRDKVRRIIADAYHA